MQIKVGDKVKVTNHVGDTFEARIIECEWSGWLAEPIQGEPCTFYIPETWNVVPIEDQRSISPVLNEALNTATAVQRLLNAANHYISIAPDEAIEAIDTAIERLEETMDGLDSGTIQLIVALGKIKAAF